MVELSKEFKAYQFVIAGAPNREKSFYENFIKNSTVAFVPNRTYDLLNIANAALVTSGTATLETALFKVPQVVCYKTSALTYFIGKLLVKNLKYFSLVNLIMDAPIVAEILQKDFNKARVTKDLSAILNPKNRKTIFENYLALEEKLGGKGASETVATILVDKIQLKK